MSRREPFGVYVHVPFCLARCDYCAFATWTDRFHLAERYVDAVVAEARRAASDGMPEATSVFFGGGTPSLLAPDMVAAILDAVARSPGAEVTLECNPDTVDLRALSGYRDAGVTRLSFGVQSMKPSVLRSLGRSHGVESVRGAVAAAGEAGFGGAYSVDLIYGAAGETVADWEDSLRAVLGLDPAPAHVSAYALTVEPGTPLATDPARHPEPDDQADKYALADKLLADAGLQWYEISNWSRPGAECRHNQLYWSQGPYRGLGCSAHSHAAVAAAPGTGRRWWNVRTPERYIALIETGEPAVAAEEEVRGDARRLEALQLALRTRSGVPEEALPGWEGLGGLLERDAGTERLVLTVRGRLLANEVALRLTP